ncbi:Retrovirus-related Pol polyprotein from transposon 17.6 [Vitis vinifera]|uniref:Retrovirus-related Pol polyprotein from transposon 17.6 n=1 Tax=Vitis vinifera TaxID=29760 RepID=A0A438GZ02_VITVI|nr:Retrovirus-related Pol polyprotein from transposon 17.6 [Vitis vinifera]
MKQTNSLGIGILDCLQIIPSERSLEPLYYSSFVFATLVYGVIVVYAKWIRDIGGRLVKCDTPQKGEFEVILNIMEAAPEDQHSHQGRQDNLNEFRSMRDRMHPPRMSAPSCIVPPTEQLVIRPYLVPLLPTFHGMESENPYAHIKEFEDVCNTFQEGGASIDLMRLKLFPFTLKDKAKIWLNSLRPRSIRSWTDLQAEYMEAINACPHHGFDTWLLVSYFYDGMSSSMKQLLETMCGGDFMSKNPEEAMDFLSYVADVSRGWDEPTKGEVGKMKSQLNAYNAKAGMYNLKEDDDMKAKLAAMTRRLEELELKRMHEVQAVAEAPVQVKLCPNCQSFEHLVEECPAISAEREMYRDQANVVGQFRPNNNAPMEIPTIQVGGIIQISHGRPEQLNTNSRIHHLSNLQAYKFEYTARKGRFPSQPNQNPKGVHEVESHEGESSQVKDVKALITLRSGKKIEQPTPKPHVEKEEEIKKGKEMEDKESEISEEKKDSDATIKAIPEKELLKEEMLKKSTSPPFPQALHGKKGVRNAAEILKGLTVNKKAFLTEQVSAILQCKSPLKYKDPGSPTISVMIGGKVVEKALLDLGASVNLLPYSVYKQLGLGELKPTAITLSLADRSVKIPRGVIEDVLVQVDNFYYPVDFVVLDTDPTVKEANLVPIILGRPFLATSNAIINSNHSEEEEGPEELCIIDTLVEEHCNQHMQDKLNESLVDIEEGFSESPIGLATLQSWRKIEGILPLFNEEEEAAVEKEIPKLNLKPLPVELKYTYLEANNQCPVVISSLTSHQENCLMEVLRRCKKAIGWQISDLKGISPLVCTHHIYMEEEAKPIRQFQRRLNPHLQEVVRAEVLKLLQAGIIYPISDSPWVSPTQVVPKKSGITVIQNEKGEEITTRLTSGWRVCIDYRKLNAVTRKDHFPLPFIDKCWRESLDIHSIVSWMGIQGIEVDKAKVELIAKLPSPTTVKGVRQFLGHAGFYRRCQHSFDQLKKFLTTTPIVRAPNWQLPFELMCDASDFAIGAVLGQREDGKPYVIYYASKTLNEAQRNYTTTEKELLAVFDLQIKDKKGVENVVADHLSRLVIAHNSHPLPINDDFPEESLMFLVKTPWYAHIANYLVTGEIPNQIIRKCVPEDEQQGILSHCHENACGGHFASQKTAMKAIPCKQNDHRVVLKFLKENIFSRFGVPKAIISDGGAHFCNKPFEALLSKYGVKHKVATPYHPQTSGQVELANREIKNILMKVVNSNRKDCLVGNKEAEHGLIKAGEKRFLDLNEMEELRNNAYINSKVAKQRMKKWHDQLISNKEFQEGQKVLMYDTRLHIFPGKLKSRWIGPFVIHRVYSNGVVDLLNSNGKDSFRVNGYRLKPFMESFKSEKEAINLLEPQKA